MWNTSGEQGQMDVDELKVDKSLGPRVESCELRPHSCERGVERLAEPFVGSGYVAQVTADHFGHNGNSSSQ